MDSPPKINWKPEKTGDLSDAEAAIIVREALKQFRGGYDSLSGAIGFLFAGRHYGWRVMYLVHSRATIAKYERILGVKSREVFAESTEYSQNSLAYRLLSTATNFWKAVKGETHGVRSTEVGKL